MCSEEAQILTNWGIENINKVVRDIYLQIDDIKYSYDLTDDDVLVIDEIRNELIAIRTSYDKTVNVHRSRTNSYSRLAKEMEIINVKLTKTEEKLDGALRSLGSLKEDEQRAREQLGEIKNILLTAKDKINTYDGPNMRTIHAYFNYRDVTLLSCDFEEAVKDAKKGDFIYFDPPYDSDTSTFNSYTEDGFDRNEQVRLARVFKELSDKGCYVMLSNHNTSLIKELYKDFNIHLIEAKRNINANGKKRGKVEEVIITNY